MNRLTLLSLDNIVNNILTEDDRKEYLENIMSNIWTVRIETSNYYDNSTVYIKANNIEDLKDRIIDSEWFIKIYNRHLYRELKYPPIEYCPICNIYIRNKNCKCDELDDRERRKIRLERMINNCNIFFLKADYFIL